MSDKFTTTVWTKTAEHFARASFTESAFEGADARLLELRRQVAVAGLAVRTQLKHVELVLTAFQAEILCSITQFLHAILPAPRAPGKVCSWSLVAGHASCSNQMAASYFGAVHNDIAVRAVVCKNAALQYQP